MTAPVCIANIGPAQRQRRFRSGVIGIAIAVALLVAATRSGPVSSILTVVAAAALFGGFTGVFQARAKT